MQKKVKVPLEQKLVKTRKTTGETGGTHRKKKTSPGSDNPEDKIPPKRLISILRDQITKRNLIINAIREAYETDVITLRNQLYRWRENKPEHLLDQRVLLDSIPSLNFGGCIKFLSQKDINYVFGNALGAAVVWN